MADLNFDLLDSSVEDLADLKGFEPHKPGTHKFLINFEQKAIGDNNIPSVSLKLKLVETIELANSSEEPHDPGHESDVVFMLTNKDGERNEISEGQLKDILASCQEIFGGATLREVMENSSGGEIIATTKIRVNKNDTDQKYTVIKPGSVQASQ